MKNEEFNNIITLSDEDGNGIDFELVDLIEYKGAQYVVLFPVGESEEDGDFVILRLEAGENEDEQMYVGIDDEETVMAVFDIFRDRVDFDLDVVE